MALSSVTAVQAGPLWHLKKDLGTCAFLTAIFSQQGNCAMNVGTDEGYSNDWNRQKIKQKNEAELNYEQDFRQLNVGGNLVVEGDGNHQSIRQKNEYENYSYVGSSEGPTQTNYAINVVEDGDHNSQSISQSNSLTINNSPY
jgi:hypothetical protein